MSRSGTLDARPGQDVPPPVRRAKSIMARSPKAEAPGLYHKLPCLKKILPELGVVINVGLFSPLDGELPGSE